MSATEKGEILPPGALVVGTVHSTAALRAARRMRVGAVDLLELRVDHFAADPAPLRALAQSSAIPMVVTVRHPREGGAGGLSRRERERLYREFLPFAAMIDVELQSAERLAGLLEEARALKVAVIVSDHHFRATPAAGHLERRYDLAVKTGADLVKVAAHTEQAADVARLLGLFATAKGQPLSVMGMGPLGKASRLLFARAGSRLNYGYLGEAQVPGQWEAVLLKRRLAEVMAER